MLKPKDLSMPGVLLITLSQLFSGFQTSEKISLELQKFRAEFQQSLLDRETYFARKTELLIISDKIDHMNDRLIRMNEQMRSYHSKDHFKDFSFLKTPSCTAVLFWEEEHYALKS